MKVKIELQFGSDFQKEYGMQAIYIVLLGIKQYLESRHKKNKVTITYEK